MTEETTEEIVWVTLFEPVKQEPPEFRLYYDEAGKVICYTTEKLEGNYIVIDNRIYAESRPDVRVVDGKISKVNPNMIVSKLMPDNDDGVLCASEDLSIIVKSCDKVESTKWKLNVYELN
jgi:hypothetical protein